MPTRKTYDLICSLGANCSAAFQLRSRGLRFVALPFDWTSYSSLESVEKLAEGFTNGFANFMQKENLRKLEGEEYSKAHTDRWQYEDIYTKFRYYNHFYKVDNEEKEQDRVIKKFRKRCEKLDYFLNNSKRVLLILSAKQEFPITSVENLLKSIQEKYPNCEINIYYQAFGCAGDEQIDLPNLTIRKYKRYENIYDYTKTNFEWNFMDNLALSPLFFRLNKSNLRNCKFNNILLISKIKKGYQVQIFRNINTVFYCKLYLFGLRMQFILGKERNE